jgi:predicted metal-dependent hydrolase
MTPRVEVVQQARKSLAMKVTPGGIEVLIPAYVDPESAEVRAFVAEGLAKLAVPGPVPEEERIDVEGLRALVEAWAARLGVTVSRLQVREMRTKWGSMSTQGTLTLAADLVRLPRRLAEYVVVHELLHLCAPRHDGMYKLLLGRYLPDWRERERALMGWVALTSVS